MNGTRRMLGLMLKVLAFGWVTLGAMAAQAADFSVGRVEVEFAEQGWKEVPLPDSAKAYGGDKSGALDVQSKLYVLGGSASDAQVLVLVSAATGGLGGGYMTYSGDCQSDAKNYREGNPGIRRSFTQCLTVTPRYSSESVLKALAPAVLELQHSGVVSVPRPAYTVWNYHAVSTGTFVDVRVFVMSPLAAIGTFVAQALPEGVPPEHVAWGRQLIEAVKSSVYSVSGRLVVPAIRLAAPPVSNTPVSAG